MFARKVDSSSSDNGLPELDMGYRQSVNEQTNAPAYKYPKFYDRNEYTDNNGRDSKSSLIATLKKQINTAMGGHQSDEMSYSVGLDIDDISDLANNISSNQSFATHCESSDNSSGDEAEEWRDVLSFFCCDGLALTAEQIEAGMSLVRRDSSFIIKSNSLRVLLNSKENC